MSWHGRLAHVFEASASRRCLPFRTHTWFGGDWRGYLRTRIRIYVDGEEKASIDMELGLGVGFDDPAAPWGIAAYRFHEDDPLFFKKGLRLTCRCGEKAGDKIFGGDPGDPKPTTYTTYAWVYEW